MLPPALAEPMKRRSVSMSGRPAVSYLLPYSEYAEPAHRKLRFMLAVVELSGAASYEGAYSRQRSSSPRSSRRVPARFAASSAREPATIPPAEQLLS
jgi:hypothetical protein